MNKTDVTKFVRGVKKSVIKHTPEILTGVGIVGMFTTTVLAVTATPKALRLLEEKKEQEQTEELPVLEVVKTAWKPYIPAAVTATLSTACLIGASSVSNRRNAALAAAYALSKADFRDYKEKVVEVIGEKKEKQVREEVSQKKINENPVSENTIFTTEKGNTLCFDVISGRYFKSDLEKIKRAVNKLNRDMLSDHYISLNEFYIDIGLPPTKLGEEMGWNIDVGFIELDYSARISEDETPCIVIDYLYAPEYNFQRLY